MPQTHASRANLQAGIRLAFGLQDDDADRPNGGQVLLPELQPESVPQLLEIVERDTGFLRAGRQ